MDSELCPNKTETGDRGCIGANGAAGVTSPPRSTSLKGHTLHRDRPNVKESRNRSDPHSEK